MDPEKKKNWIVGTNNFFVNIRVIKCSNLKYINMSMTRQYVLTIYGPELFEKDISRVYKIFIKSEISGLTVLMGRGGKIVFPLNLYQEGTYLH